MEDKATAAAATTAHDDTRFRRHATTRDQHPLPCETTLFLPPSPLVFSELLGKLIFELSDSIDAADARDELFGDLVPALFNAVLFVSIACQCFTL